jgi:aquaporin Z
LWLSFGTVGSIIALSRIGKERWAHINPAVTSGFWLMRKPDARAASGYVIGQMLSLVRGALPLLASSAGGHGEVGQS